MRELPILFSGAMVRAILDGRKTQTRRILKPQPEHRDSFVWEFGDFIWSDRETRFRVTPNQALAALCSYGVVGDRLWAKETFVAFGRWETRFSDKKGRDEWHFVDMTLETGNAYRYGGAMPNARRDSVTPAWWTRPSIFMPRAASRITLEVTGVRVERLDDISETDARAEGVTIEDRHMNGYCAGATRPPSIRAYRELWDSLNDVRGHGWNTNPWVWVMEFKRIW